jgi:hypothetical protein
MKNLKLTIDLLPKGAWGNNLSKTLQKDDWDALRNFCYQKAESRCEICGYSDSGLDAHEVWDFDIKTQTQTLKDIVALCSACHGVKHMRNSERMGYGENAKRHFLKTNGCDNITFAKHYAEAQGLFDERNKVLRWKIKADLTRFGGEGIEIKQREIPLIVNPYEDVKSGDEYAATRVKSQLNWIGPPKIRSIEVDNYQGEITVISDKVNKIEWSMNGELIKTKYNVVGKFITKFSVEDLKGSQIRFRLTGDGGQTYSQVFVLKKYGEVL